MSTSPRLPPELCDHVIDQLRGQPKALKACSAIGIIPKGITPQYVREGSTIHDWTEQHGAWDPVDILRGYQLGVPVKMYLFPFADLAATYCKPRQNPPRTLLPLPMTFTPSSTTGRTTLIIRMRDPSNERSSYNGMWKFGAVRCGRVEITTDLLHNGHRRSAFLVYHRSDC
ncbi:hypothetical protein BDM02DRAFT_3121299 [Thelephora ganbajun]|uniref:Uncharacterized protein n=1 Tax=Thelephora ganbajun TaxID=370292 RepID=A0ACB6Z6P2_THEGA|nr:hypothetical protein BDM02DRAFT_3121299 [Thelephora ganbajun]